MQLGAHEQKFQANKVTSYMSIYIYIYTIYIYVYIYIYIYIANINKSLNILLILNSLRIKPGAL